MVFIDSFFSLRCVRPSLFTSIYFYSLIRFPDFHICTSPSGPSLPSSLPVVAPLPFSSSLPLLLLLIKDKKRYFLKLMRLLMKRGSFRRGQKFPPIHSQQFKLKEIVPEEFLARVSLQRSRTCPRIHTPARLLCLQTKAFEKSPCKHTLLRGPGNSELANQPNVQPTTSFR